MITVLCFCAFVRYFYYFYKIVDIQFNDNLRIFLDKEKKKIRGESHTEKRRNPLRTKYVVRMTANIFSISITTAG